jgi:hypothetical protein
MKTTQSQAAKRLFKKLSALRATLPNEERAILDSLVVFDQVSAHRMTGITVDKATFRVRYDPNSEQYKTQE